MTDWDNYVKVGAINCAEQECGFFNIQGTPTIRVFYPATPTASTPGVTIKLEGHDANTMTTFLTGATMEHVAQAQKAGLFQDKDRDGGVDLRYYK